VADQEKAQVSGALTGGNLEVKNKGDNYPGFWTQAKQATLGNLLGWVPYIGKYFEMSDDQRQAYADYNNEKAGDNTVPWAYRAWGSSNHGETLSGSTNFRIGLAAGTLGLIPPNKEQREKMIAEHGATGMPNNYFMKGYGEQGTITGWIGRQLGLISDNNAAKPVAEPLNITPKQDDTLKNSVPEAKANAVKDTAKPAEPVLGLNTKVKETVVSEGSNTTGRTITYNMASPNPRDNPTVMNNGRIVNETEQQAITRGLNEDGHVSISFQKDKPASLGDGIEWLGGKIKGWFSSDETKPVAPAPVVVEPVKPVQDKAGSANTQSNDSLRAEKLKYSMQNKMPVTLDTITNNKESFQDFKNNPAYRQNPAGTGAVVGVTVDPQYKNPDGSIKLVPINPVATNTPSTLPAATPNRPSVTNIPPIPGPVAKAPAETAEQKLANIDKQIAALEAQKSEVKLGVVKEQYSSLTNEAAKVQANYVDLTKQAAAAQAQYSNLTNEAAKAQANYSNLTNQAAKVQANYSSLTNQAAQVKTTIDTYNSQQNRR
jgi:hypothetical protein